MAATALKELGVIGSTGWVALNQALWNLVHVLMRAAWGPFDDAAYRPSSNAFKALALLSAFEAAASARLDSAPPTESTSGWSFLVFALTRRPRWENSLGANERLLASRISVSLKPEGRSSVGGQRIHESKSPGGGARNVTFLGTDLMVADLNKTGCGTCMQWTSTTRRWGALHSRSTPH